jgi:hypothetical protein
MDMDRALSIFNSPSLMAYVDYTHQHLYREVGEFEFGYDDTYDELAYALAYVSVEMVLDDDLLVFVPTDDTLRANEADRTSS